MVSILIRSDFRRILTTYYTLSRDRVSHLVQDIISAAYTRHRTYSMARIAYQEAVRRGSTRRIRNRALQIIDVDRVVFNISDSESNDDA